MNRRIFLNSSAGLALGTLGGARSFAMDPGSEGEKRPHYPGVRKPYPLAISTSNFCGPQFVGMWRDVEWHRRLTDIIHSAPVEKELQDSLLARRMEAMP